MSKFYIAGRNQTKTVTPSNIQQTIEADTGYNALDAVVVNPIAAAMPANLEDYIMRNNTIEPFSLSLSGAIPSYACYGQTKLAAVYGQLTAIGEFAFWSCSALETFDGDSVASLAQQAFRNCINLKRANFKSVLSIYREAFRGCTKLLSCDFRNCTIFNDYYIIWECPLCQAIDLRNVTKIGNQSIDPNTPLILLDITNTHSATLASSGGLPGASNFTILVADATDKAYYQSATNWSAYASKIKTVAEYEQQIGMSYNDYYEIIFGHPRFDNAA